MKDERRQAWPVAVAILASALSIAGCAGETQRANVLLVVVDTLRADHLGSYADVEWTPHLDEFAAESVVFEDALSTAPNTINSAPSILTSRYPSEHQYTNYRVAVAPEHQTLAESLLAEGYETFAVSTNPHVTARNGMAQGFTTFLDHPTWTDTDAQAVNGLFFEWLDARTSSLPFFAMLWYVDPHTPYEPPGDIRDELLDEAGRALVSERTIRPGSHDLSDAEMEVTKRLYRGEVMSFDRQFGTLMDEMRRRGLFDETIIVFTSDHGESCWEHAAVDGRPLVGHGVSMFRTELAIPLMVRFPDARNARRVTSRVSTIDIVPTLLSVVGAEYSEDGFHGRDLTRLIAGGAEGSSAPPAFSELYTDFNGIINFHVEGVSTDAGKLVVTYRYRGREMDPVTTQLFDVADRPLDAASQPLGPLRDELSRALEAWRATLTPITAPPVGEFARENELLERLRALGYLR